MGLRRLTRAAAGDVGPRGTIKETERQRGAHLSDVRAGIQPPPPVWQGLAANKTQLTNPEHLSHGLWRCCHGPGGRGTRPADSPSLSKVTWRSRAKQHCFRDGAGCACYRAAVRTKAQPGWKGNVHIPRLEFLRVSAGRSGRGPDGQARFQCQEDTPADQTTVSCGSILQRRPSRSKSKLKRHKRKNCD